MSRQRVNVFFGWAEGGARWREMCKRKAEKGQRAQRWQLALQWVALNWFTCNNAKCISRSRRPHLHKGFFTFSGEAEMSATLRRRTHRDSERFYDAFSVLPFIGFMMQFEKGERSPAISHWFYLLPFTDFTRCVVRRSPTPSPELCIEIGIGIGNGIGIGLGNLCERTNGALYKVAHISCIMSGFYLARSLSLLARAHSLSLTLCPWVMTIFLAKSCYTFAALTPRAALVLCPRTWSMQMRKPCAIVCPVCYCKYWLLGQSRSLSSLPLSVSLARSVWALGLHVTSHFPLAGLDFLLSQCYTNMRQSVELSGFTCLMSLRPRSGCLFSSFARCCPPRLLYDLVKLLWLTGNLCRTQDEGHGTSVTFA